jgi:hypothetical protein
MPRHMDMWEDACGMNVVEAQQPVSDQARPLTYDEKKAAEAAFRGDPFNPAWSAAAAKVYAGIVSAVERIQADRLDSEPDEDWVRV